MTVNFISAAIVAAGSLLLIASTLLTRDMILHLPGRGAAALRESPIALFALFAFVYAVAAFAVISDVQDLLKIVASVILLLCGMFVLTVSIFGRRSVEFALRTSEELARARGRVVTAQETVRRDIALQLHGSVQNKLILLMHRMDLVRRQLEDEEAQAEITAIHDELRNILEDDVRIISRQLYPSILRQGIVPAIQSLADQTERVVPVDVRIDADLMERERADRSLIPEPVRLGIYRIAEEAVTNAVKHANADHLTVRMEMSDGGVIEIEVEDNGAGFDAASTNGSVGLAGMADYADTMGGTCAIVSRPGSGTRVRASIPVSGHRESTPVTIGSWV